MSRSDRARTALRSADRPVTVRELCQLVSATDPDEIKHFSTTLTRLFKAGDVERSSNRIRCSVTHRWSAAYRLTEGLPTPISAA